MRWAMCLAKNPPRTMCSKAREGQSGFFELDNFLAESRKRIDSHLDAALPTATQHPIELHRAMRYAVFSGGKRVRPALAFGPDNWVLVRLARRLEGLMP